MTRRRRYTLYLTEDEHACIDRAATEHRLSFGRYAREHLLVVSGFAAYSGPMFAPGTPYVDRSALFVVHDMLRIAWRLARHAREVLSTNEIQVSVSDHTVRLLLRMVKLVRDYPLLSTLKLTAATYELAYLLEQDAREIAVHSPILGNELAEMARVIALAVLPDDLKTKTQARRKAKA